MTVEEFHLPDVGEGIAEAEIVSWHVPVGQPVRRDQPLVAIETDKAVLDIPAPCDGTLRAQGAAAGTVLPVGGLLARIERATAGTALPAPAAVPGPPSTQDSRAGRQSSSHNTEAAAPAAPAGLPRRLASPATRRLASRLGVDLAIVEATGPAGRVTRADVERHSQPSGPEPSGSSAQLESLGTPDPPARQSARDAAKPEVIPLRGTRRQVARSMTAAAQVPTIYEWRDVDATRLTAAVEAFRTRRAENSPRITLLALIAKAVVTAAASHRRMNGRYDPEAEELTVLSRCHLGIATATEDGLLVPVVRDASSRSLTELTATIADLTDRARRRALSVAESRDGTITISNFGSLGVGYGTPLLRLPEVTVVGVGRIAERVVPVAGQPVVRPVLPLSIATDHRVNDGAQLAEFCATLADLLADPVLLLAAD